jgi:hypothetical protein
MASIATVAMETWSVAMAKDFCRKEILVVIATVAIEIWSVAMATDFCQKQKCGCHSNSCYCGRLPWQRICVGDRNVVAIATVVRVVGNHGNRFLSETKIWVP